MIEFNNPFKRPYKPGLKVDNKPLFGDMIFKSSSECYDGSSLQTHMVDDIVVPSGKRNQTK
jgi:hypothetical protein